VIGVGRGDSINSSPWVSRRDLLKLIAIAGTVMAFAPFVDWGKFLPNTQSNIGRNNYRLEEKLILG
jgi:hypothetical protein